MWNRSWTKFLLILLLLVGVVLVPFPRAMQAQIGGTLGYGSAVFGTLSDAVPMLTYSFQGGAGDLVTVEVMGLTGGLEPLVTLSAPDGSTLHMGNRDRFVAGAGMNDTRFSLFLPQAGSYSVLVNGANGTVGDFLLRLQGRVPVESTPLVRDTPVTVEIAQEAAPQYYTFEALDCPTTLTVMNLSTGLPFTFPFVVRVRNEQGRFIALLRGGETLEDRVTVAANSGLYEVEVLSDDPALGGLVSLVITCGADAPGCVGGAASAGDAGVEFVPEPACPEPGDFPSGDPCEVTNFAVTLLDPVARTGSATWDAVPGADQYRILVYIMHPDGEFLHGSITFSDAGGWIFDFGYLPDEYTGLHFVLEVWGDGVVICLDEAFVVFRDSSTTPECAPFDVSIIENTGSSITAAWTEYPGAGGYVVTLRDGATYVVLASIIVPAAQLNMTFPVDPGSYVVSVSPWDPADGLDCVDEITVEVRQGGTDTDIPDVEIVPSPCSIYLQAPREGMANGLQTFYWTAVEGAGSYRLVVYNESGAVVAEGAVSAPATSITLDVSTAAIGGGFSFTVAIEAYLPDGTFWCVDAVTQLREAPPPPTHDPVCGNGVCEQPTENGNMCPEDCSCNFNGICEPIRGEAPSNCSADCPPS